jgi:hypothetical protein
MKTAEQENHDSISAESKKNADMGIVVPAEKIMDWNLTMPAVRN